MKFAVLITILGLALAEPLETVTQTVPATTWTGTAGTFTSRGRTSRGSTSTETIPATTVISIATTVTLGPITRTYIDIPSPFVGLDANVLQGLIYAAPTITSLPSDQITRLKSAFSTFQSAFTQTKPFPSELNQPFEDLASFYNNDNPASRALYFSIIGQIDPWASTADPTLESLLMPFPTLASDISRYNSVARTYYAELYASRASIVTSVLSLTGPPPTFASVLAAALTATTSGTTSGPTPTGTITSSSSAAGAAAAAPTSAHRVAIGAGIAAAGLGIVAML